jgi:hypothetical protein
MHATIEKQHAARKAFDPIAERVKGLINQVDSLYKLASRAAAAAAELAKGKGGAENPPNLANSRMELGNPDSFSQGEKVAAGRMRAEPAQPGKLAHMEPRNPDMKQDRPTLSFSQGEKVAAGRMRAEPDYREVSIGLRKTRTIGARNCLEP